jgi:hypothetical protein
MPHGGRRPGAGAPRGNTNALKFGVYSPRYQLARLFVTILPPLVAELNDAEDKDGQYGRRRHAAALLADADAAIDSNPDLATRVEDCILDSRDAVRYITNGPYILELIEDQTYYRYRLPAALAYAGWLIAHDREGALAARLVDLILGTLRAAQAQPRTPRPRRSRKKQSNNQTINPNPPARKSRSA